MTNNEKSASKRIRLLGIPLDIIDPEFIDAHLEKLLQDQGAHQIVFLRTLDLMRARRNPELRACLEKAALVVPVSKALQSASRHLHLGTPTRHAPFDFMIRLLNVLESIHGSYYLLGDVQPYLNRTELNLRQTFPGAQALGRYSGSFPRSTESNIIIAISKAAPNLLLVGSGLHGKNLWVHRRAPHFPRGVQVWCAECFQYFTSRRRRPNKVSFRNGREFYRESMGKPYRWFRFPIYAYFRFLVLIERIRHPRPVQQQ